MLHQIVKASLSKYCDGIPTRLAVTNEPLCADFDEKSNETIKKSRKIVVSL